MGKSTNKTHEETYHQFFAAETPGTTEWREKAHKLDHLVDELSIEVGELDERLAQESGNAQDQFDSGWTAGYDQGAEDALKQQGLG